MCHQPTHNWPPLNPNGFKIASIEVWCDEMMLV